VVPAHLTGTSEFFLHIQRPFQKNEEPGWFSFADEPFTFLHVKLGEVPIIEVGSEQGSEGPRLLRAVAPSRAEKNRSRGSSILRYRGKIKKLALDKDKTMQELLQEAERPLPQVRPFPLLRDTDESCRLVDMYTSCEENMPTRPPTIEANPPEPSRKLAVRAQAAEKRVAKGKQALRLGQLLDDRNTGRLDDEVIKIAQAMLLCTLPYSATTKITSLVRHGLGTDRPYGDI